MVLALHELLSFLKPGSLFFIFLRTLRVAEIRLADGKGEHTITLCEQIYMAKHGPGRTYTVREGSHIYGVVSSPYSCDECLAAQEVQDASFEKGFRFRVM